MGRGKIIFSLPHWTCPFPDSSALVLVLRCFRGHLSLVEDLQWPSPRCLLCPQSLPYAVLQPCWCLCPQLPARGFCVGLFCSDSFQPLNQEIMAFSWNPSLEVKTFERGDALPLIGSKSSHWDTSTFFAIFVLFSHYVSGWCCLKTPLTIQSSSMNQVNLIAFWLEWIGFLPLKFPLLFPRFLLEQDITNSYASLNGLFIELLTKKMPNLKVENYLLFGRQNWGLEPGHSISALRDYSKDVSEEPGFIGVFATKTR